MGIDIRDFMVTGEKNLKLEKFPTSLKLDSELRPEYEQRLETNKARIEALQDRLYAEARESLVIVLQAMDAAGKDSTIRHVLGGVSLLVAVIYAECPSECFLEIVFQRLYLQFAVNC